MKIVAHRGASSLAVDNSLKAIDLALDCKVDVIEFDLQITKDQVLVLNHDPEFVSEDGESFVLADSLHHNLPDILSLNEAVAHIQSREPNVEIMLDCKGRLWSRTLARAITRLKDQGIDTSRLIVISFSLSGLVKFKLKHPGVRTIYLWRNVPILHILLAVITRQNGIGYPITNNIIALPLSLIKKLGLDIYFYRVNNIPFARRAESLGIEYIGTDKPTVIVPAIKNIKLDIAIKS